MTGKRKNNTHSSWLNLQIKIDLNRCLTRQVLFEKYSEKEVMRYFFIEKINECKLFKHEDYPNSIFYIKHDGRTDRVGTKPEILMEQDFKNKVFYIKYADFWLVFSSKFGLNYTETRVFIKDVLENTLKLQDFTTYFFLLNFYHLLEDTLKLQDFTPGFCKHTKSQRLEDTLKLQDFRTAHINISIRQSLEDTLKLQDFTTKQD